MSRMELGIGSQQFYSENPASLRTGREWRPCGAPGSAEWTHWPLWSSFLEAHERAFEHFGGHTLEHLYDRARTVCHPSGEGVGFCWNGTFRAFAQHWGFEPRVCQPYRACTKGKVESGVKLVKGNFLPGRVFIDIVDFQEQLSAWNADIADIRIHGTTHERPIDRFDREREHLVSSRGHPSFLTDVRLSRLVASDYLVTLDTNRYSVPYHLIGQAVEVERRGDLVCIYHRGELAAEHGRLTGRYQLSIIRNMAQERRHARHGAGSPVSLRRLSRGRISVRSRSEIWPSMNS